MTGEIIVAPHSAPIGARRTSTSPALVYLASLAAGSRPAQLCAIKAIVGYMRPGTDPVTFPWHELQYEHVVALRTKLAEDYAPATANRTLAALRGVLKEAWRLGLIDAEHLARLRDVPPIRGKRLLKGRALAKSELKALLATCNDSVVGIRDAALLTVLYSGGLRRAEIADLDLSDYDPIEGELTIRAGKGNKARVVPIAPFAIARLDIYVSKRGDKPGPLFHRMTTNTHMYVPDSRLTPQAVRYILEKHSKEAGIAACSPHDFRRSMISAMLDNGTDIVTVQALAGHANVTTTARYDRRGDRAKRDAARRLTLE